jgi:hypothetical protein
MSKRTTGTAKAPDAGDRPDPATETFLAHRSLLFTVAYEMLGSAAEDGPAPLVLIRGIGGRVPAGAAATPMLAWALPWLNGSATLLRAITRPAVEFSAMV